MAYQKAGTPLVIIAGKEYGTGSSRDWAAKGTVLLGVRAVIAESFERIHRSNLVGMGVLPLEFTNGDTRQSLGLTGFETFDIDGLDAELKPRATLTVRATRARRHDEGVQGPGANRYAGGDELLQERRNPAVRAAAVGRRSVTDSACGRRWKGTADGRSTRPPIHRQYFGTLGSTSSLHRRIPPVRFMARNPAERSRRTASALRTPDRQYTTTSRVLSMDAIAVCKLPSGIRRAPGIRPISHSYGSRTSISAKSSWSVNRWASSFGVRSTTSLVVE